MEIGKYRRIQNFDVPRYKTLSYSADTWVLTKRNKSSVQTAKMRSIHGKTRWDRIRNTEIRERLAIRPLQEYIEQKRLQWFGHVKQMTLERLPRRTLEMKIKNRKHHWEDQDWGG